MGKWDRRRCRRRYNYDPRRYMFQENVSYPELDGPAAVSDNVPSWEKDFCSSIGCVSWRKLLFTRNCMFGNESVLNWDDSAGKEAFQVAKNRFLAKINGCPSEINPHDPDIYAENVNWNSDIDPELVQEVDRAYFNPDLCKETLEQKDCDSSDDDLWDSKRIESKGDALDSLWAATNTNDTESSNPADNNPWEQGFTRESQNVNWQQWRSPDLDNCKNDANPWEQGKNDQWRETEPSSWGQGWNPANPKKTRDEYYNKAEGGHAEERSFPNERRWRNRPRDGENWRDDCRKRGNFDQGGSSYKSSRYRVDGGQTGPGWSQGRANNRASFAGSRY